MTQGRIVGGAAGKLLVRVSFVKTALLALGSALLAAASGVLCASWLVSFFTSVAESPATALAYGLVGLPLCLVAPAGLALFGRALFFYLRRLLLFRRPVLEVGPAGILDRASIMGVGFVPWEEIKRLEFVELRGQRLLAIKVGDAGRLFERQNPVKRWMLRANRRYFPDSQVNVPLGALAISEEELVAGTLRYLGPRGEAGARLRYEAASDGGPVEDAPPARPVLWIARAVMRWVVLVVLSLLYYCASAGLLGVGGALAWNSLGPGRFSDFDHPVAGVIMLVTGALFFVFFPRLVKRITGRKVFSSCGGI